MASGTSIGPVAKDGARVHHHVRREWMARLDQLRSAGHGQSMHDVAVSSFGLALLFEVEAFRAEDLASAAEAGELSATPRDAGVH